MWHVQLYVVARTKYLYTTQPGPVCLGSSATCRRYKCNSDTKSSGNSDSLSQRKVNDPYSLMR